MGPINALEKENENLRMVYLRFKVNCEKQRASLAVHEKALIYCRQRAEKLRIRLGLYYGEVRVPVKVEFLALASLPRQGQEPNWEEVGPKTWYGYIWINAFENLESPDSPEPLSPAEVSRSGVSDGGDQYSSDGCVLFRSYQAGRSEAV